MGTLLRRIWTLAGRAAYVVALPGIKLVVRGSHRTRVLLVHDNQFLVVKHWLGDTSWMLPGGGAHKNEAPLAAAQRELAEELGLQPSATDFQHIGHYDCADSGFSFTYDLYIVELASKPALRLQRIEILEAKWFNRTESRAGVVGPEVATALANWPA